MGEAGVVDLCRRLVVLTDELEVCREALRRALLNGGGERTVPPTAAGRPGETGSRLKAAKAAEAEAAILDLLRGGPMRLTEIVGRRANSRRRASAFGGSGVGAG
jgi:hypothetical protein